MRNVILIHSNAKSCITLLPCITCGTIESRDRANGLAGTAADVSFLIVSVISGFLVGFSGMYHVHHDDNLGDWFGTGSGRGLALVFTLTGIIGLLVTLEAMRSKSYKLFSVRYNE